MVFHSTLDRIVSAKRDETLNLEPMLPDGCFLIWHSIPGNPDNENQQNILHKRLARENQVKLLPIVFYCPSDVPEKLQYRFGVFSETFSLTQITGTYSFVDFFPPSFSMRAMLKRRIDYLTSIDSPAHLFTVHFTIRILTDRRIIENKKTYWSIIDKTHLTIINNFHSRATEF